MNLYQEFQKNVKVNGSKILAKDPYGELSYTQCYEASEALAKVFHQRYPSASHIAFLLPSIKEVFIAVFAAIRANMASVPLNFLLTPQEILKIVKAGEIKFIFTTKEWGEPLKQACDSMGLSIDFCFIDDLQGDYSVKNLLELSATCEPVDLIDDEDRMALLLFTSGTTGFPKGVMLSHKNLLHNINGCKQVLNIQTEDKILGVLPYFHTFALTGTLFLPALSGCLVVLVPRFKPALTIKLMKQEQITLIALVPSMYKTFLSPRVPDDAFSTIRTVVSGGEALPVSLAKSFHHKFDRVIMEGYGMTETSPVISVNAHECPEQLGSVGHPIDGTTILILDEEGQELAQGRIGEIAVKSPSVMLGYFKNPQETDKIMHEGALLTGDMGYLDENENLIISGRKKELIISAGENVYPTEVEDVAKEYPGILECAVIGKKSESRGETVIMVVSPIIDEKPFRAYLNENLPNFKRPKQIFFQEELPKNPLGKIIKKELTKLYC
ncbi:MAG: AMP-binding protein [Candidatus Cloacimonetes bacterium]|nr:AMP-binding protein [Candidatus Cloacimonadota bacterium]